MPQSVFLSRVQALLGEGTPCELFAQFRDELVRFNRGRNLVSRAGGPELVERLILESVAVGRALFLPPGRRGLDLGSGAGFPGIPLALSRPDLEFVLLDRRATACDFLRREVASLGLPRVRVEEGQAREVLARVPELRAAFAWGFARAVAAPVRTLALLRPFLGPGGTAVLVLNQEFRPSPEILAAGWQWKGARILSLPAPASSDSCLQLFRPAG